MALITSHLLPPAPQCFEHPNLRIDDIYKVSSRGLQLQPLPADNPHHCSCKLATTPRGLGDDLQLQPLSTIPNHCSCERSRCELTL